MSNSVTSVLVVANRTAATDTLMDAVRDRAERGDVTFHLLVPSTPHGLHRVIDPEDNGHEEAKSRLDIAVEMMRFVTRCEVTGTVGVADPVAAISDAMHARHVDEIIISTLPTRLSRWMRLDLPSKMRAHGLPVTHVSRDTVYALAA